MRRSAAASKAARSPWRDALRVAREVLAGLGYAHGRGVVHRDLKPENVLFDDVGRARLVDFGLSRLVRGEAAENLSRLTRTNVILGTYEYMAPEQRLGRPVDERADLYALGVILYEMLTGALPLGRFEAASVLRPGVPPALDPIVHRALAPAPKDRFPSAIAFLEAIDVVEREARPATTAEPARTPLPVALGNAHAEPPPLPDGLDRVRRHVDWIATGNRVIAVLAMLVAAPFAMFSVITLGLALPFAIGFGLGGYFLFGLANRLQRYERGARDTQLLAAVLMSIFLPPVGWIVGIPSFLVLMSADGRALFDGRRARQRVGATHFPFAWSTRLEPPPPAPRARSARDLVGHGLVVWALAVLVVSAILSTTPWSSYGVRPEQRLAQAAVFGAVFTALWVFLGARRTVILTILATAIFALLDRSASAPPAAPRLRIGPTSPADLDRLRGSTPVAPPLPPVPDDRGRGRGRSDR